MLHSICQQIWKTQQWPQDWKGSAFIPIPKKDNTKECSNYCTIALISHASKVMLKIPQVRLQQCVYLYIYSHTHAYLSIYRFLFRFFSIAGVWRYWVYFPALHSRILWLVSYIAVCMCFLKENYWWLFALRCVLLCTVCVLSRSVGFDSLWPRRR